MMKKAVFILCAMILLFSFTAVRAADYGNVYGSCKKLSDRTVILSIFADDTRTQWDMSGKDYWHWIEVYDRMTLAVKWIEKNAAAHGVRTDLVWDFYNVPYLYSRAVFSRDMQTWENADYNVFQKYIDDNLDVAFLKKHFNADSIIFAFYFNAPLNQKVPSFSWPANGRKLSDYTNRPDDPYNEICVFFSRGYGRITVPAAYAHEILHCFGGVDLYSENKAFNISQEFSDWYRKNYPDELFMSNKAGSQTEVDFEMTEVTQYYLGLISHSPIVERWGLKKSDYELIGY